MKTRYWVAILVSVVLLEALFFTKIIRKQARDRLNDDFVSYIQDGGSSFDSFLKHGADVNGRDRVGHTPLQVAAAYGNESAVRELLEAGADVNVGMPPEGWPNRSRVKTALHWAAYSGHTEILKLLIEKGADVNAQDWGGATPLMLSTRSFNERCWIERPYIMWQYDFLRRHQTGVGIGGSINKDYETKEARIVETVKILLENDADPSIANRQGLRPTYYSQSHQREAGKEVTELLEGH